MQQKPFTIVTEIRPEGLSPLKEYLRPVGDDIVDNGIIEFSYYTNLHYCCFVIIENMRGEVVEEEEPNPILVFEGNIDDGIEEFIQQMIGKNGNFLRYVYRHCLDYPQNSDDPAFADYLLRHDKGANAFYIAHPGRSVFEIKREMGLREEIETYLDDNRKELIEKTPAQIHDAVRGFLKNPGDHKWAVTPVEPPWQVSNGLAFLKRRVLLALLLAAAASGATVILFILFTYLRIPIAILWGTLPIFVNTFLVTLRWKERTDTEDDPKWITKHLTDIQDKEDVQLQNHLTSITYVKKGWFRLTVLRVVLWAVNAVASLVANKGKLAGIATIHFARWVIIDGAPGKRKRLLFLSNYDGSWESYLGEFIDQASTGLTAIWSNTELGKNRGFPKTKWLVRGGATDEQRFKAIVRNSQRRELVWYSAYPHLSIKNVGNNMHLRDDLSRGDSEAWLKRL